MDTPIISYYCNAQTSVMYTNNRSPITLSGHKFIKISAIGIPKQISPHDIISLEVIGIKEHDEQTLMYFPIDIIRLFIIKETTDQIVIIIDTKYGNCISTYEYDVLFININAVKYFEYQLLTTYFDTTNEISSYYQTIQLISYDKPIYNLKNGNILGIYIISDEPIKNLKIITCNTQIQYNDLTVWCYNNLKQVRTSWTKKHDLTLIFCLNKILPIEMINIIKKYIDKNICMEYVYYFPFETYAENNTCDIKLNLSAKRTYYVLLQQLKNARNNYN